MTLVIIKKVGNISRYVMAYQDPITSFYTDQVINWDQAGSEQEIYLTAPTRLIPISYLVYVR